MLWVLFQLISIKLAIIIKIYKKTLISKVRKFSAKFSRTRTEPELPKKYPNLSEPEPNPNWFGTSLVKINNEKLFVAISNDVFSITIKIIEVESAFLLKIP